MKDSIFLRIPKDKQLEYIEQYKEAFFLKLKNKKKRLKDAFISKRKEDS
jgi:hypothetical protein